MSEKETDKEEKGSEGNKMSLETLIAIVLILIIIVTVVLYLISLGKIDFVKSEGKNANAERLKWLNRRHKKLDSLIQKKEVLSNRLTKLSNRIYFISKVVLVGGFLSVNSLLLFKYNIPLDNVLNYNQVLLVGYICACFIIFDRPKEATSLLVILRLKIRKVVFKQFANLDAEITNHRSEMQLVLKEQQSLSPILEESKDVNA